MALGGTHIGAEARREGRTLLLEHSWVATKSHSPQIDLGFAGWRHFILFICPATMCWVCTVCEAPGWTQETQK